MWLLACDLDGTLLGGDRQDAKAFSQFIQSRPDIIFVVATGRPLDHALNGMKDYGLPKPQAMITSVGTEIHYGEALAPDHHWHDQQDALWDELKILDALKELPFLGSRGAQHQGQFKIAFEGELSKDQVNTVKTSLAEQGFQLSTVYSHDWFLDLMPEGINKATAILQVLKHFELPSSQCLVAGDSGNDTAMLTLPEAKGVLVANHLPEVNFLRQQAQIYCAEKNHAAGVMEGIDHWLAQS